MRFVLTKSLCGLFKVVQNLSWKIIYILTKCERVVCTVSSHISSVTVALFVCFSACLSSWRGQECRLISRFPADKSRWVTGMTQPYPSITRVSWNSGSIKELVTSQAEVSLFAYPYTQLPAYRNSTISIPCMLSRTCKENQNCPGPAFKIFRVETEESLFCCIALTSIETYTKQ